MLVNTDSSVVLYQELQAANGKLIGVATLNSEKSLNALSLPMVESLLPQLQAWQADPTVAMVMLQGAGDKAFCAGGDIRDLYQAMQDAPGQFQPYVADFFCKEYTLDYLIHTFGKPVLVWGNGIVMGGGLGLMAGASHRIVTASSRIAMPEMAIGLYPDVGASWFLNRMPAGCGLFLGLTGASINAADARFIGLADVFICHEQKAELVQKLCSINWGDTVSLNHQKLSDALRVQEQGCRTQMPLSQIRVHQEPIAALAQAATLAEVVNSIMAMPGEDKWLTKAKASLSYGSPITAHIVFRLLQLGQTKILADSFRLELGLSVQCGKLGEFQEGVRALLIDKDLQPKWLYPDVAAVPVEVVAELFRSPWPEAAHPLAQLGKQQQGY
ncbi:MAG: enoyl-CoA hydratase/isomerase family protein [Alishewanella sp.]|uniref:enoyl-CoA hydratase/isomerase family protein n=1 Tax=Gammaproteobacteria TaxID=1236 RepID=UPI001E607AC4|nr:MULTISPECIES: enoyl-CoA hydratase/isomerase family protein [unclassified Rheinheimera]MCC5450196.1 enoyl-CoA hydratase/isomerase family protein [Rheinheimera sp. UJ51]MCF4009353.1 enoyl-CoA hydratase/isomerase family protein [Rheinheimera sp. UJ63]MDP5037180.1 enoyl-CoA hydratase/isomerase family protein [Alishewanella sp.]MDP5187234.1 enoyl-CoA hydratase/isomerase family protein [Alishewanella sp.]